MAIHTIGNRLLLILIFLFVGGTGLFAFGAGIFYPKKVFDFYNLNRDYDWGSALDCLNTASELTPEINVLFRQPGNSFKAEFYPEFLTKQPYSSIYIKEIVYIYEGKEFTALSDAAFTMSPDICDSGSNEDGWITNGTYYWMNGWTAKPENWEDKTKLWPETNFEKIFKDKKVGDEFLFSIRIVYRFDEDEEKTLLIPFIVKTVKGEYLSPFAGL